MNGAELRNTCCLMESNRMEECDSHHPVRDLGGGGWGWASRSVWIVHACLPNCLWVAVRSTASSFLLLNVTKHLRLNPLRREH